MSRLRPAALELAPELFEAVPLESAMEALLVTRPLAEAVPHVALAACQMRIARHPELAAGLWIYADDLEACHRIVQDLKSPSADWWHAIVHRREGDLGNAAYWYRQARRHPAWEEWANTSDAARLNSLEPVAEAQRHEWAHLFSWCAENYR
ncbi:MAG TPA: hypothetical protein DCQ94_13675 [Nitrospira sp.]|mgnify:CR=1 FL=1|nr:hypothetical protein [Nitrospira sp.]